MTTRTISQQIDLTNQAEPVNRYITKVDSDGIKIHPEDQSNNNYIQLNGNGLDIYKNNTSVAQFGSSGARIGKTDQSHVDIRSEGIRFYGGNNNVVANIGYDDVNNCYYYTFGERDDNYSVGEDSFAEGHSVAAIGKYSHAEGEDTSAEGQADHAEGFGTETSIRTTDGVELAHFGYDMGTSSGGSLSVAPFYTLGSRVNSSTVGNFSVAEGNQTVASGYVSHAEGETTTASGYIAHAEGTNTTASGHYSHAEGTGCSASGIGAHAEGISSTASGDGAHAQNYITRAASDYQTAIGKANKYDYDNEYALIIGNGTADNARSNAVTVDWSGNVEAAGNITDGNGNVLSNKANTSAIPTVTSDLTNDSHFVDLTSSKPLFKKVSVQKTFSISASNTANQSFAPASADIPSGYTRVGLCGWNTANGNVFIVTCTGTTITFGNKSSSSVTCTNAQVDWLYIRSSV